MKRKLLASSFLICGALLVSSPIVKVELSALDLTENMEVPELIPYRTPFENGFLPLNFEQKGDPGISVGEESSTEVNQIPQEPNDAMPRDSFVRLHSPGDFFRKLNPKLSERFVMPEPRFKPHKNCKRNGAQLRQSFKDSLSRLELSGEQLLPEKGAILDLNFYFQHAEKYYQLSMEPTSRSLADYRITLLQSTSPDFSTELMRIDDGKMSQFQQLQRLDALTSLRLLVDDYSAQGARWGARTTLLADSLDSSEDKTRTKVEFHNGALRGFMNNQQECHLADDNSLECLCW